MVRKKAFFVGIFDGKPDTVAFECYGKGFGGDIGVMVAVKLESDEILGVGVTTHSETPGVGTRAKTDPALRNQFRGMELKDSYKVKTEGGQIDALSGATVSSKGVCGAVTEAALKYNELKPQLVENVKKFIR